MKVIENRTKMELRSRTWHLVCLTAIIALSAVRVDGIEDDLKRCCNLGKSWAQKKRDECENFPVPVPNIPFEIQTLCLSAMEICCVETKREQQCESGVKAGQAGRPCLKLNRPGGEQFRDCCVGCKLGLQVSAKSSNCREMGTAFGSPWDATFTRCCEEIHNGTFTEPIEDEPKKAVDVDEATRISLTKPNKCPQGFRFNSRLNVCDDVDECTEGTHDCDDSVELCRNTIGNYICEELEGVGAGGEQCAEGFKFFLISCIDVDECAEELDDCVGSQVCVNNEGGYTCEAPSYKGRISACPKGYQLNDTSGLCEDINECKKGLHDCVASQRCDNTVGSFNCVRYTTCGTGYTLNYDSGRCEDDDECAMGTHNCQNLGKGYLCHNTQGSFRCARRQCNVGEILNENGLCSLLRCQSGFEPGPSGNCIDIDECEDSNSCALGQRCENTMGSFRCISQCELGLQLDPVENDCVDVDECSAGLALCFNGRVCVNTIGSYRCECPEGFRLSEDTGKCEDINECVEKTDVGVGSRAICGVDSECQNSIGSFRCVCKPGFKHQNGVCVDINECQEIRNICQQRCTNLWGSYRCHCQPGFRLSPDDRTCVDVDECNDYADLCVGNCRNEPGSYKCTCPQGYTLSSNGRTCQDNDECFTNNPCRGANQHCFNTRGGYKCNDIACPAGYDKEDGHDRRCRRRATRCRASDIACKRKPVSISYNFIALISNLRVQGQGVNLFTMQSARYHMLTTKFTLKVKNVRAPKNVEAASAGHFRLKTGTHSAILSIVKPIQGPQDVTLELLMEMYHLGRYQASASANIYIYVTPYEF